MKKSILPAALMAAICGLLSCCAPVPTTTPVFPSLSGSVVDAEGYAIPGALVTATRAEYMRQDRTSSVGKFTLPAATQLHYAMIAGPPGVKPAPWFWQRELIPLVITAEAPGYETVTKTIQARKDVPYMLYLPDRIQFQLYQVGGQAQPVP